MDRSHERDALHGPWPSRVEELAAQYADRWTIYRELRPDGTHGDWAADSCLSTDGVPEKINAKDIESLAEKLAVDKKNHDPELQVLQEEWAPGWSIWRARRSDDPPDVFAGEFVATRLDDGAGTVRFGW